MTFLFLQVIYSCVSVYFRIVGFSRCANLRHVQRINVQLPENGVTSTALTHRPASYFIAVIYIWEEKGFSASCFVSREIKKDLKFAPCPCQCVRQLGLLHRCANVAVNIFTAIGRHDKS